MQKIVSILILVCTMHMLPSCGTNHCTDDNSFYAYLDPNDLLKQPYYNKLPIHFYGNKGNELTFNVQEERKSLNQFRAGGDPDCPVNYYDEKIEKYIELQSETIEFGRSSWLFTYQKGNKTLFYNESNEYRIALWLRGELYFDTKFYENKTYRDSVFIAGEWHKAHHFQNQNNYFTWTAKYGISTFLVDSEEFILIP